MAGDNTAKRVAVGDETKQNVKLLYNFNVNVVMTHSLMALL